MQCKLCSGRFRGRKRNAPKESQVGRCTQVIQREQVNSEDFCSAICFERRQLGWNQARCDNCFDVLPRKVRQSKEEWKTNPVFCSAECRAVFLLRAWRIGKNRKEGHGTDWNEMRAGVRVRDGHQCQACGKTGDYSRLYVDHIVPFLLSQSNDLENLVLLCQRCHSRKTRIENALLLGRIGVFLQALRKDKWPMSRVRAALRIYGLPVRVRVRMLPRMFAPSAARFVIANGKRCHIKVLDRWLIQSSDS
jgi:hypothetical protein